MTNYTVDDTTSGEPNTAYDTVYDELVPYVITAVTPNKKTEQEDVATQATMQDEIPVYLQVV